MGAETNVTRQALLRLRKRREELGLSQAEVAETAGINPSYVGLLERGERIPSLEVLVELGGSVGLSLSELFAPSGRKDGGVPAESAAIGSILAKWPGEHRKAALRVIAEMDKLLRASWR